jgi:hypothetical protein
MRIANLSVVSLNFHSDAEKRLAQNSDHGVTILWNVMRGSLVVIDKHVGGMYFLQV